MEINLNPNDIVDYLNYCNDEDFAEIFVKFYYLTYKRWPYESAEDMRISADDMKIDIDELTAHIKATLDEIIYSEDIDASAWWKGEDND